MAADVGTRAAIDDVFNDNFSDFDDDPFADKPTLKDQRDDKAVLSPRPVKRKADGEGDVFGLGLDQEVKIAKKRRPVAKLDEARLLSEPGIPKIRSLIRSKQFSRKLRLKGKGHEFTDAAKLLNYYQLWLDNLYPRAKFADALKMVEKAGHTKRMQMTRSEWINESKPGYIRREADTFDVEVRPDENPDLFGNGAVPDRTSVDRNDSTEQPQGAKSLFGNGLEGDSLFIPDAHHQVEEEEQFNDPDDDELDALLTANNEVRPTAPVPVQDDSEGEDDLDALLAEQDMRQARHKLVDKSSNRGETNQAREEEEEEEEDDLDALLAEQEAMQPGNLFTGHDQATSSSHRNETINDHETIRSLTKTSTTTGEDRTDLLPSISNPRQEPDDLQTKTTPPSQELVDENLSPSSSPLPNNEEDEDDDEIQDPKQERAANNNNITNDIIMHDPINEPARPIEPAHAETEGYQSRNEVIDGLEIEEDFLASSPIESLT